MSSGRRGASSHGVPGRPSQAGRSAVFRSYIYTHPGLDAHAASLSAVASSALVRLVAQRRAGERLRSGRSREVGAVSARDVGGLAGQWRADARGRELPGAAARRKSTP